MADQGVGGIRDVNIARAVNCNALRIGKLRGSTRPVGITAKLVGETGHGSDHPIRDAADHGRRDLANRIVDGIRDKKVARAVHRNAFGPRERRGGARAVGIAAVTAGDRGDHPGRRDLADRVPICNVEIACAVHREIAIELVEPRGAARAVGKALVASSAGQGGDHPVRDTADDGRCNLADHGIIGIRNVEASCAVHGDTVGGVELRGAARPVGIAGVIIAGEGGDHPVRDSVDHGRGDLADRVSVCDVEIARLINRNAGGVIESRVAARPVHSTEVAARTTGDGRYHPVRGSADHGRRDLTDREVDGIRNVEIACTVDRDVSGLIELRSAARAVDRANVADGAGNGGDHSGGRDLADQVVVRVRDKEIARTVHGHATGAAEPGGAAGAIG